MLNCDSQDIVKQIALEICRQVMQGYERLNVDEMMKVSPWGRRQTERNFRDVMLTSPRRYFRDCQAEIAREYLHSGEDVLTASMAAGFSSTGRLHDALVMRYGLTPGEMRQRGQGVKVCYGLFSTQIGVVLIAATERGVCFISLCGMVKTPGIVESRLDELRALLPQATLNENADAVQEYGNQLVAFLDQRSPEFCPPLDILQGTTFQREVWAEIKRIAPGEVLSYSQLAQRIGRPKAVRAVAQACGHNHLAIAIPCHRVMRSDGTLAGYRWGVEWKERLLSLEAALMPEAE